MALIQDMIHHFPREIVDDAVRLHKHLAPGIILAFKMALRALQEIGSIDRDDIIVLTSETTRCIPDGLQTISRHMLVNGGFHVFTRTYDVGKLSIQVTKNYKDLFRLVLNEDYLAENKDLHAWVYLPKESQLDLDGIRKVMWDIDIEKAFVTKPFTKHVKAEFKGKNVVKCAICGESTSRTSMVEQDGKVVCKTCAFFD